MSKLKARPKKASLSHFTACHERVYKNRTFSLTKLFHNILHTQSFRTVSQCYVTCSLNYFDADNQVCSAQDYKTMTNVLPCPASAWLRTLSLCDAWKHSTRLSYTLLSCWVRLVEEAWLGLQLPLNPIKRTCLLFFTQC